MVLHSKIRLIQNQQMTHQGVFGGHWFGSTIFGNTVNSVVRWTTGRALKINIIKLEMRLDRIYIVKSKKNWVQFATNSVFSVVLFFNHVRVLVFSLNCVCLFCFVLFLTWAEQFCHPGSLLRCQGNCFHPCPSLHWSSSRKSWSLHYPKTSPESPTGGSIDAGD